MPCLEISHHYIARPRLIRMPDLSSRPAGLRCHTVRIAPGINRLPEKERDVMYGYESAGKDSSCDISL